MTPIGLLATTAATLDKASIKRIQARAILYQTADPQVETKRSRGLPCSCVESLKHYWVQQ